MRPEGLPDAARQAGQRTFRHIVVNGREIEFSEGFADFHTAVYREILAGRGFGLEESRPAIETVAEIHQASTVRRSRDYHPLVRRAVAV